MASLRLPSTLQRLDSTSTRLLVLALALAFTLSILASADAKIRRASSPRPPPRPRPSPSPPKIKPSPPPPRVKPSPPPPKVKPSPPPPKPKASPPPPKATASPPPPKVTPSPVPKSPPPAQTSSPPPWQQPTSACSTTDSMTTGRWLSKAQDRWYDETCPELSQQFKCSLSDSSSLFSWQPDSCNLPTFNPATFAARYSGKSIAFVGDSIMKNIFEALACALAFVSPRTDPVEIDIRGLDRKLVYTRFNNLTMYLVRDPFLVDDHKSPNPVLNDFFKPFVQESSLAVFTLGHWFVHNSTTTPVAAGRLTTVTRVLATYLRSLWQAPNNWQGTAVVMTYTPVHKDCTLTKPFTPPEFAAYAAKDRSRNMTVGMLNGLQGFNNIKVLDVTDMSLWRPDAHAPSDCSHWCTPGLPNTWLSMMAGII